MRSLFIVVSKVYGLVQAYTGLTYIFTILPMLRMFTQQPSPSDIESTMYATFHGEQLALSAISLGAMVILTFGLAWLLIFRTEWLADKLKLEASDTPSSPSVKTMLYAGTKLIALFVIVQTIPRLTDVLFQLRHMPTLGAYMWSTIAAPVIRIMIGAILMLKTDVLVNFIVGKDGQNITLHGTQ